MTTKLSPFDSDFSRQYQSLKRQQREIQQQINPLVNDPQGKFPQIKTLVSKRKKYDDAIIKLLQSETKKYYEQYAKKMFDISFNIITTFLSDTATNFDKLSINEKLDFGQTFINRLAEQFEIQPNKLEFHDNMPDAKGAEYDFKTENITINKKQNIGLQNFIGMILHEFTHHLYTKHPEHSPIGEQKAWAVMENFVFDPPGGIRTPADLQAYKNTPFEAPAYYVQEYFEKHKFAETVLLHIKTIRQSIKSNRSHGKL